MKVDLFDFELPPDLIALRPVSPRDAARQLIVHPDGHLSDDLVAGFADHLNPGDVLVFNDTRVIPARLTGRRTGRGDSEPVIEVTLHQRTTDATWLAFAKPGRKLNAGDDIRFSGDLVAHVQAKNEGGEIELGFGLSGADLDKAIAARGVMPLPPYIASKRPTDERDADDYQTMFAARDGAVAAPTASLHFTKSLMQRIAERGVAHEFVTLHVGAGTFLPVKADDTTAHKMHSEWGEVDAGVANRLTAARAAGGRIIAIGTTALRLLESAVDKDGRLQGWSGATDIFITPGYRFAAVDGLMTNFHLPRSTLFMLVSAFCGLDTMQAAYAHAIANGYRFYSYGDSSLLWPVTQ
ncbi:MAG: tRNA preQ1(34) S-adenosylmethionine ribosyltransferase-isomerase QueA [Gammaproteobacteria bacterium]|nr:tRNA preQ1(34) S-adenosylmethionine ribosyltransferase-isomerase QueA [Gammaproteobacteria bacterium]